MTAAFSVAAPSIARSTGRGASASTQSHKPAERAVGREHGADAGGERVEGRVPAGAGLHDRLDLGAVLVVVAERREGHRRLARVAVAQDQEAGGRHALGQDLAAQDRRGWVCSRACSAERMVSRVVGMDFIPLSARGHLQTRRLLRWASSAASLQRMADAQSRPRAPTTTSPCSHWYIYAAVQHNP